MNKLVEAQKAIVNQSLIEAKKKIAEGDDDPKDGGLSLFRAYRGLPKNSALIKFLSEPGIRVKLQKTENYYLRTSRKKCLKWMRNYFFTSMKKITRLNSLIKALHMITKSGEDPEFFILPDIGVKLAEIEKS